MPTAAGSLQEKTSRFRGVFFDRKSGKWRAEVQVSHKKARRAPPHAQPGGARSRLHQLHDSSVPRLRPHARAQEGLGYHPTEEAAAGAVDRAQIVLTRGQAPALNLGRERYEAEWAALAASSVEALQAALGVVPRRGAFSSPFKGVRRRAETGKRGGTTVTWRAEIGVGGGKRAIGCFASEELAARAYDVAVLVLRAGSARTNFADGVAERIAHGLGPGAAVGDIAVRSPLLLLAGPSSGAAAAGPMQLPALRARLERLRPLSPACAQRAVLAAVTPLPPGLEGRFQHIELAVRRAREGGGRPGTCVASRSRRGRSARPAATPLRAHPPLSCSPPQTQQAAAEEEAAAPQQQQVAEALQGDAGAAAAAAAAAARGEEEEGPLSGWCR